MRAYVERARLSYIMFSRHFASCPKAQKIVLLSEEMKHFAKKLFPISVRPKENKQQLNIYVIVQIEKSSQRDKNKLRCGEEADE